VRGQQIGTHVAEVHPLLTTAKCIMGGTCTNQATSVVPDANWRWLHITTGTTNCYTGNTWNTAECPDLVTCAANCSLDGAAYGSTYSISTSGNALTLDFDTGSNVGSRVYLMDGRNHYEEFMLMNQEFTFDVDVSNLPCGLNGALYFSQMPADGGMAANPGNKVVPIMEPVTAIHSALKI
jgi:cellulose 1,4-beta-cellobiosidase